MSGARWRCSSATPAAHWQLASSEEDKKRVRGPATHFKYPLLKPNDVLRHLPQLLPCDIIVNGIGAGTVRLDEKSSVTGWKEDQI